MIFRKGWPKGYERFVFIAYGFYILLGGSWLVLGLLRTHAVNPYALLVVAAFGAQLYYRHLLTNLILGVLTLFGSVMMLLEALNLMAAAQKAHTAATGAQLMVALPIVSLLLSGVLIFSFQKLNFKS